MQKAEYITTDTTVLSASQNASPFIAFFPFIFNSNGIFWTANAVACCIFPHSWSYIFIPSCKNNLFIPFLSPAWDGSHFPHSLWFYHNCLPTYVLCLSYRVFLLQKAAKQFSPAAEKWWSVQKSLCWINCKPPYPFQGKQYSALTFPGWFGGSFISLVVSSQSK